MKHVLSETKGGCVAKVAVPMLAFFLSAAAPAISQTRVVDAALAAASASLQAPRGVNVLARVPLDGLPVTRMYTQWESGRTYLYLAHAHTVLMPTLSMEATAYLLDIPSPWTAKSSVLIEAADPDTPVDPTTGASGFLLTLPADRRWCVRQCAFHKEMLDGQLYAAGARFLPESNAATYGIPPGSGLHLDLTLLHRIGLSLREALAAATSNFADVYGWRDVGRVERGGISDLLLLDADSRTDISAVDHIHTLVCKGAVVDRDAPLAGSLTAASGQSTSPTLADPVLVQPVVSRSGTASSGWIDFTPHTNFGIYLPVKINGHDGMALLYGGPSNIDTNFVASLGLTPKTATAEPVGGITLQLGNLTLQRVTAAQDDLQKQGYEARILGHPVLFRLGEVVFNQVAVDIDFSHHRVAFRDPATLTKPVGAVEIPLVELDGERVLPVSVNGAALRQFELELGNVIGPLMVTGAYAEKEGLLQGHPHSQRLSGRFIETVVSVGHLSLAGIDFPQTPIALIPDSEVPPASITGGVGLPLLAKFRLIIDYSHNRLYAIPDNAAVQKPTEKDRIGLVLDRNSTDTFAVAFVAPNSPAEAAGFKKGDKIALIDGKPFTDWPLQEIIAFQMADAGTVHTLQMVDGTVRQVKAKDFF